MSQQVSLGREDGTYTGPASVHLQSTHGCHQHHYVRHQTRCSTLDVEELLHANVSTKAGFRDCGESSWKPSIIVWKQQDRVWQPLAWLQFKGQPKFPPPPGYCPALRRVHMQRETAVAAFQSMSYFLTFLTKLALSPSHHRALMLLCQGLDFSSQDSNSEQSFP